MQELFKRILSGVVYAGIVIGSMLYSEESFYFVFYLFMILCLYEFKKLIKLSYKWTFIVATLIFLRFSHLTLFDFKYLHFFVVISLFIPFIYQLFKHNISLTSSKLGHYFLAIAYIVLPFVMLTEIPFLNDSYDPKIIIGIFILIWIDDSFAYIVGSTLGRNKLFEKVSPNKTVEGAIGGLIAALLGSYFIALYCTSLTLINWLVITLILVIFGLLGDLIESKFKREAGLKDSSNLIPGHGGFLDRLDSIIFAAPFVYVYLHIL
jgi:phosphatidate cytidylyltransferase